MILGIDNLISGQFLAWKMGLVNTQNCGIICTLITELSTA